jgi:signal transduction histidine kinase
VLYILLTLEATAVAFLVLGISEGNLGLFPILIAGMLAVFLPWVMMWRGASMSTVAWTLCLTLLVVLFGVSASPSSTHVWAIAWCAATPLISVAVGGWRTGLRMVAVTATVQTAALVLHYYAPNATPDRPDAFLVELIDAILLTTIVGLVSQASDRSRDDATARVDKSNTALRTEIERHRTTQAQLHETHAQLLESARVAGMAEIASGVLHNVGNALNSLRTSASIVGEGVCKRRDPEALDKLSEFLSKRLDIIGIEDHPADRLPEYLNRLAERRRQEDAHLQEEVDRLQRQVDHVAAIISVQQQHAGASGVLMDVDINEAIEQSVLVSFGTANPLGITITIDGAVDGPVVTDRHQLLQIMTNLITNARDELRAGEGQGIIQIGVTVQDDTIRLQFNDSGRGVTEAHRTSVFRHGFTTKPDGHGFGLHLSALAARALGGNLSLSEHGALPGATFVLDIPLIRPLHSTHIPSEARSALG